MSDSDVLKNEDGRFHAIDKFKAGTIAIATSEKLGKQLASFSLPSAPAMFLNLAHASFVKIKTIKPLELFDNHPQGIWPENHEPLFDFFENFISHVVFSHSALEALANEVIPNDFCYNFTKKGETLSYKKEEIERCINLDEKLDQILPAIFKTGSPKGKDVWEKYKKLKEFRDRIIHLKSIDRSSSGVEKETIWGDMLRLHKTPFCNHAHEMMGYFVPIKIRRWHLKYPYKN